MSDLLSAPLANKQILVGVTGGIAAYKAADLCRQLVKAGATVRVVLSQGAQEFVQPLTFQALTGNAVHTSLLDPDAEAGMGHIELAKWPDLILVAPATAHFIAQYAHGFAGDLLTTILLASEAPVAIAPAMNQAMWRHPMTQANVQRLSGVMAGQLVLWGPSEGEQACGDTGPGRMMEPLELADRVVRWAEHEATEGSAGIGKPMQAEDINYRVTITAGPTREALDPVRYITNHSSGKMGFALAAAYAAAGAEVTLIAGPVTLATPAGVSRVDVTSAAEMLSAAQSACDAGCDIFIAAAAVADYRALEPSAQKIKKNADNMHLALTRNPDIIATIAARQPAPFCVGFAAETQDVLAYARGKLERKKLNMIIANDVSRNDIGFNADTNEVSVITPDHITHFSQQSKQQLAIGLVDAIHQTFTQEKSVK